VRLHVGELASEQFFGASNGDIFDLVIKPAAAVVALAGVSLAIFIGEDAAGCFHDGRRNVILAGDQFQRRRLARGLLDDEAGYFRIGLR